MESIYRVHKEVSHEEIDGEVIVIHFITGNYYSLRGAAAAVWRELRTGRGAGQIEGMFAGEGPRAEARRFLEDLVKEELVEVVEGEENGGCDARSLAEGPVLEKYTDLQNLLLADPIHDVEGEQGWPVLQEPPSAENHG